MTAARLNLVVRQIRGVVALSDAAELTEAELWDRYVRDRNEAAFETLVRRHGPMVLGVCRRILRNEQDAEDAFQATFLVLIRRAASLRSPRAIANWLHGVARRTALAVCASAMRRRLRESSVIPESLTWDEPFDDLQSTLDHELEQIAEKYRIAVVLCDLEGMTRKEAARRLGWAQGTVASRLARGRGMLAKRLARRGLAGALVGMALASGDASGGVPVTLVESTLVAAACSIAETHSPNVFALTEGVMKAMLVNKVKRAIAVLLVLGTIGLGASGLISTTTATEPPTGQGQNPASSSDLDKRLRDLKLQIEQMQRNVAMLEHARQPMLNESAKCDTSFLADRFKCRVPFEIGYAENSEGGRIEIREVWGTRPMIEVGGQYLVKGKYRLPPGQHGKIYFYATAGGAWGQSGSLDLQFMDVDNQEGEFAVVHGMAGPGWFHLVLADPDKYSHAYANVYFGTGDNVNRQKP